MTQRILVVDDELNWRRTLGQIIEDMGYEVRTATCLSEAKQFLESLQFVLALVDINLDGLGLHGEGGRLFYLLCEQYPQIPVIAITATSPIAKQMRDLFIEYRIKDFIEKDSFDVWRFTVLIRVVIRDDTQVTQGLGTPPTGTVGREKLDVSPAIRLLAALIRARREAGDQPYTLLLGSSLSLTPEVRQAVCGSDDWEAFWTTIQGFSATERRSMLAGSSDSLNLTAGYHCLAQLVRAGYFDLVLTLNVDDALDESLRILSAREYQIFTHGQVSGTEIAAALSRSHPRVKAVKLRGDINAYKLPLTPEGQFEFPQRLEEAMERLLSQDTILVGDIPYDTDIQRCIRKGGDALWVVVPKEPRPGSFLYNAKKARPKGEVISGAEAEFVSFFSALARELGVESSEVSDGKPPTPMTFEFTFDVRYFKFSSWFPVLESLIPVLPDEIRAKEALYAEGYLDYPPDRSPTGNNRTKWLDKFLQAIVDGEATSGYIALHNLSKDGAPYDHLKVTIDTQSKELKIEITDSTRPERRQALASRILERIGRLKGVRPVTPSRHQRSSQAIIAPNPFGDTGRITDPERFFGREELLRQIFEELGKGVNLSLVGESKIGKSSLLSMVCALGPGRMGLPPETFAYLSLEWVDSEDEFYEALCDALSIETCRGYKLTRALRGKRYVLCLDEIEKMTWDGFTVRLRSQLRGLADGSDAPLKLVIASRSPLAHLFPDSPELDSPLAGICRQLDVGPFPPDVAHAFLAHRLRSTGVTFTESEISALLAKTGGNPAKLQRAAADLYRRKSNLPESSELSGR